MRVSALGRHLADAFEVPRDLLLRRYPRFVTGGPLERGEVPVFVFHSLEPTSFEAKLRHLADNGYRTLSADEYFAFLEGRLAAPERAVVLTFDDGRASLWGVGLPLLRRYGLRGLVFLIPGRMASRAAASLPPTLDDVAAGRAEAGAVVEREARGEAFLSFEEVEALARAGVYDFESHSLSHARVHVAPRLAGFRTAAAANGYAALDVPWVREGERDRVAAEIAPGTPLLRSDSRLSERPRFFEDPEPRAACIAHVAASGGAAFFERPDWERELRRRLPAGSWPGRYESGAEREEAQRHEIAEARRQIVARTGRAVRAFCYPWHVSGPTTRRLLTETGHAFAFCGKVPGVPVTLAGGDPLAIARVGEDYLELLPGRGRRHLTDVLASKWRRRFGGGA